MSSFNEITNSIKQYLASHFMYAEEEWLSGCVEYLTQDPTNNYNAIEIQNLAREQWLLNDLKDICPGSLPANLKNQHKTELNGKFVLQINAAIDIGTPAYQQYLKLQKINMENIEATTKFDDKIPSHRMIKLYLTDGVQNISGIEYKPMRNISCDITPGCKVLIKGPVTCRRGTLLLTESSVELLGGEAEEITATHSLPALLSSKLGVTLVQDTNRQTINPNIPQPHSEVPIFSTENLSIEDNRIQGINNYIPEEDIDFEQLAAIEAEFTNNKRTRTKSPDDNVGKKFKRSDEFNTNFATLEINRIENNTDFPIENEDYLNEPDLFLNEDEDYLREVEARMDEDINPEYPLQVNPEPYIYIRQINELDKIEFFGKVFKIKAQISKLLSKLSVSKDVWSLKCTLIDGTGCIDVEFTSDVLSELVGYTPSEMNQLKKEMVSKPELKQKAVVALNKAKDSLQVLNCIIEIKMAEMPKIIALHPFDGKHVEALKRRLHQFKV